jgi:hypothetical protein
MNLLRPVSFVVPQRTLQVAMCRGSTRLLHDYVPNRDFVPASFAENRS